MSQHSRPQSEMQCGFCEVRTGSVILFAQLLAVSVSHHCQAAIIIIIIIIIYCNWVVTRWQWLFYM